MTNDDGAAPASSRAPDSLVMPAANVLHPHILRICG
jgi:hypothetical protein